jgi:hypothetical protein
VAKLVRYRVEVLVDDDADINLDITNEIQDWFEGHHDMPISLYEKVEYAKVHCMAIKENQPDE